MITEEQKKDDSKDSVEIPLPDDDERSDVSGSTQEDIDADYPDMDSVISTLTFTAH